MKPAPRVLVIDDEEAAKYGIVRALSGQGYEVEGAATGNEAWERMSAFRPDVIVSDINMPGMDGVTLVRRVNEQSEPPLVVLITAYGSEGVAAEALRAGAYDYIPKPFDLQDLRRVVRNALEKRRLLRELKQSQADLLQGKKMASLAGLVAGIAHEMNSPLGALKSSVELIARAAAKLEAEVPAAGSWEADPRARALAVLPPAAERCRQACERISGIIQNLRAFVQLDRADFQRVRIEPLIDSAAELMRHRTEGRIRVVREYAELPEADCYPRELNQVFLNLLENAVEAIEATGRQGQITIQTRYADGCARIEIADNGCGIPAGDLDRIFDPGFTSKGMKVGTGLGLAVCFQVIQMHRGHIGVSSTPGEGSTFSVVIPIRREG